MPRSSIPKISVLLILLIFVIANAFLFSENFTSWVADQTGQLLTPVVEKLGIFRALFSTITSHIDSAIENRILHDQILKLQSQLAQQDDFRQQADFYRAMAGIRDRLGLSPIDAGIFSYQHIGGVLQVVINRGSTDGVSRGQAVIKSDGVLVGVIEQTFSRHSIVRIIGDPAFEVAARIVGTPISGLLRTNASGTTLLDLVQKDEAITEGQLVATSGDDQYPAGLVIGIVRSVDNDATTLFKIVRITPSIPLSGISGRVIIIR